MLPATGCAHQPLRPTCVRCISCCACACCRNCVVCIHAFDHVSHCYSSQTLALSSQAADDVTSYGLRSPTTSPDLCTLYFLLCLCVLYVLCGVCSRFRSRLSLLFIADTRSEFTGGGRCYQLRAALTNHFARPVYAVFPAVLVFVVGIVWCVFTLSITSLTAIHRRHSL